MTTRKARWRRSGSYYLATEYPAKIHLAVSQLPHEEVWRRANENSNSIRNLIVHLAGNIRHWIVAGIGGATSNRDRAAEFAMRDGPDVAALLSLLDDSVHDADTVIASLSVTDLARECAIQDKKGGSQSGSPFLSTATLLAPDDCAGYCRRFVGLFPGAVWSRSD